MKKEKQIFIGMIFLTMFLFIFLQSNFVSSQTASFCCEKTKVVDGQGGAWCQNVEDESQCDTSNDLRSAPTSCESTSYCQLGTCVNNQEGVCMENTPQTQCEPPEGDSLGRWYDSQSDEIPQCQLGCCLIGEQAAFTTQTRCKQLSSQYGLETNYRNDVQSETECIALATPKTKGACVFERDFQRTCRFVTKSECQDIEIQEDASNVEFHNGFLCSNENLATNCGRSQRTTLIDGKDEVYFMDTCGNQGNIYDSSQSNNQNYWNEVISKVQSCQLTYDGNGNPTNADTCGNCDYLSGSIGKKYDRTIDRVSPNLGENVCRNLNCGFQEDTYQHGESWCAVNTDIENAQGVSEINVNGNALTATGTDLPGGRHFRMYCYNGEVSVEPCADFRQEVCIQSSIETAKTTTPFRTSACRVNKWQDCIAQDNVNDCENPDRRDCSWNETSDNYIIEESGEQVSGGVCVPKYSPGLDFWNSEGDAASICAVGNVRCIVTYETGFEGNNPFEKIASVLQDLIQGGRFGEQETITNVQGAVTCLDENGEIVMQWEQEKGDICSAFGDCGVVRNYLGQQGYETRQAVNVTDLTGE
ncbi:MAG: hypothetical protein ABIH49_01735 [archaeon]